MLTDQDIEDLKAKNPNHKLGVIENENVAPGESFVVKIDPACYDRFTSKQENGDKLRGIVREFVLSVMVLPTPAEMLERLKVQPGLLDTLAAPVIKLHGADQASTSRKL